MKRIIIAVVAIASAFTISFTGYFAVNNACDELERELISICETARDGDTKKANEKSEKMEKLWEEKHDLIESFIRHEETDKLEELIKSLTVYAQQNNMARLEQQADLAVDELHHLLRNEKPILSNIF